MTTPDELTGTLTLPDGRTFDVYFSAYAHYVIEAECGESAVSILQSLMAVERNGRTVLTGVYRPVIAALMGGLEGARQREAKAAKTPREKAAVRGTKWTIEDAAEIVDAAGVQTVVMACFPALAASFPKAAPGDDDAAPEGEDDAAPLAESDAGNAPETPPLTPE